MPGMSGVLGRGLDDVFAALSGPLTGLDLEDWLGLGVRISGESGESGVRGGGRQRKFELPRIAAPLLRVLMIRWPGRLLRPIGFVHGWFALGVQIKGLIKTVVNRSSCTRKCLL
jgi:hypothetical protein